MENINLWNSSNSNLKMSLFKKAFAFVSEHDYSYILVLDLVFNLILYFMSLMCF